MISMEMMGEIRRMYFRTKLSRHQIPAWHAIVTRCLARIGQWATSRLYPSRAVIVADETTIACTAVL
ncbi:hypothetical protein ALQ25_200071 [Pseudomonas coronafaciens pv. atropurpurea]|nr:hypothetical protein AO258_21495 [Pseudomonas syringae ICMP 19498]RMN66672.1 hypothetical protein ALQ55_200230 [Pseudomonas savastanoi pv. savastanoi]RMP23062.1 hypothetical protein ALQ25_200071 [Pseudomonas coronafaciens pv. atropurpurea]